MIKAKLHESKTLKYLNLSRNQLAPLAFVQKKVNKVVEEPACAGGKVNVKVQKTSELEQQMLD